MKVPFGTLITFHYIWAMVYDENICAISCLRG